jgi:hypothetical protein
MSLQMDNQQDQLWLVSILFAAIAMSLIPCAALADPPTPSPQVEKWELIGTYHIGEGAGLESINAVIDPDSIRRDGNIFSAYVGRGFVQVNGQWRPGDSSSMVASYQIDCKYHTYNELWLETDRGFQNMPDKWDAIEPDSDVALAEKKVCRLTR